MPMQVMHIRRMRMRVPHWSVLMNVSMRLAGWFVGGMCVSMMHIMHMRMRMRHPLMNVLVLMALGEM